jgi:hypothetical protein
MAYDGPEWRFEARAVLGTYEALRLPAWLGGAVVSRGRARGKARRAVARTYAAVCGDREHGDRGLVGTFDTDPRRHATAEPFLEETATGVRCGYDFEFAVAVDADTTLATWPDTGSDRATVRAALTETIREQLADRVGPTADDEDALVIDVERAGP